MLTHTLLCPFTSVQLKSTGLDVFNHVAALLGIKELHFFGLTVVKGKSGRVV